MAEAKQCDFCKQYYPTEQKWNSSENSRFNLLKFSNRNVQLDLCSRICLLQWGLSTLFEGYTHENLEGLVGLINDAGDRLSEKLAKQTKRLQREAELVQQDLESLQGQSVNVNPMPDPYKAAKDILTFDEPSTMVD